MAEIDKKDKRSFDRPIEPFFDVQKNSRSGKKKD